MINSKENLLLDKVREGHDVTNQEIENALISVGEISKQKNTMSLEQRRQYCEVRFWISAYKLHAQKNGQASANAWWSKIKADIKKSRGEQSLKILLKEIQKAENEASG